MPETKRKTKTSSEVKNRYNKKMYGTVSVLLKKELVAEFKKKCAEIGIPQTQVIKNAIEQFLNDKTN